MSRKKDEERLEKLLRGLSKLPDNRKCINCGTVAPQNVCINFSTFVCIACSGVHREFTHRIKSVSMSKFTQEEVSALEQGGNEFSERDPPRPQESAGSLGTGGSQDRGGRRYDDGRSDDRGPPRFGDKGARQDDVRGSRDDMRSSRENPLRNSRGENPLRASRDRGGFSDRDSRGSGYDDRDRRAADDWSRGRRDFGDSPIRAVSDILGPGTILTIEDPSDSNGRYADDATSRSSRSPLSATAGSPASLPRKLFPLGNNQGPASDGSSTSDKLAKQAPPPPEPVSLIDFSAESAPPPASQPQPSVDPFGGTGLQPPGMPAAPAMGGTWAVFDSSSSGPPAFGAAPAAAEGGSAGMGGMQFGGGLGAWPPGGAGGFGFAPPGPGPAQGMQHMQPGGAQWSSFGAPSPPSAFPPGPAPGPAQFPDPFAVPSGPQQAAPFLFPSGGPTPPAAPGQQHGQHGQHAQQASFDAFSASGPGSKGATAGSGAGPPAHAPAPSASAGAGATSAPAAAAASSSAQPAAPAAPAAPAVRREIPLDFFAEGFGPTAPPRQQAPPAYIAPLGGYAAPPPPPQAPYGAQPGGYGAAAPPQYQYSAAPPGGMPAYAQPPKSRNPFDDDEPSPTAGPLVECLSKLLAWGLSHTVLVAVSLLQQ
eukprot:jgi/Mesen1/9076/ME000578S08316